MIAETIKSLLENGNYLAQEKYVEEFENEFPRHVGVKYAIATSSGTAALEVIFRSLNFQGGRCVININAYGHIVFIRDGVNGLIFSGSNR